MTRWAITQPHGLFCSSQSDMGCKFPTGNQDQFGLKLQCVGQGGFHNALEPFPWPEIAPASHYLPGWGKLYVAINTCKFTLQGKQHSPWGHSRLVKQHGGWEGITLLHVDCSSGLNRAPVCLGIQFQAQNLQGMNWLKALMVDLGRVRGSKWSQTSRVNVDIVFPPIIHILEGICPEIFPLKC